MSLDESESDLEDEDGNPLPKKPKAKAPAINSLEAEGRKTYQPDSQFAATSNAKDETGFQNIDYRMELRKQVATGGDPLTASLPTTAPVANQAARAPKPAKSLTEDLNLDKLKSRYNKQEVVLQKRDYELFQEENQDNLFSKTAIAHAADDDEFKEEFEREKLEALEEDLPKPEKRLKGWGEWAGYGVKEREVDLDKERRELQAKIVS